LGHVLLQTSSPVLICSKNIGSPLTFKVGEKGLMESRIPALKPKMFGYQGREGEVDLRQPSSPALNWKSQIQGWDNLRGHFADPTLHQLDTNLASRGGFVCSKGWVR
jgi:hypothetical protein